MKIRLLLLTFFCLLPSAFTAENKIPGADIFATNAPVLRINVDISREGIRSLQNDPRKDVVATIREGNVVYQGVMVHLKGAAGSFRDIHSNPGMTMSFGKKDPTQRFHGLKKIHLNNSVQDHSFSSENIVGGMFREAGVPTPRATNARIWLNGRDLGLYVVKEGFTKDFLGIHFKETSGNLYDGGFLRDIDQPLEKDSGDDRKDQPDLDALAAACRIEDATQRWQALQKRLDVDRFITYMAIENLTWDWDGYMANRNNYRVYHDPSTGKMVFLPHGLDQMFSNPQGSIYRPEIRGQLALVARAVYQTPEGAKRYRERIKEVFTNHFQLPVILARFDNLTKRNQQAIAEIGRNAARDYEWNVNHMRERITARWNSVKDQIANEPTPMRFDQGPIAIKHWRQQSEMGAARHGRAQIDGKPCLHIAADGQSTASWRSAVMLEGGRYRFEAIARSSRLAAMRDEKGEGAGIRISGTAAPRRNKVTGDAGWTKLQFDFEAPPGGGEVTLICESRASRGEVWFDLTSLKIEKLR